MNLWMWACRKKIAITCWVLLCATALSVAYVKYRKPLYGVAVVASNVYDAGRIKQGDSTSHVFQIRNGGRMPVTIAGMVASCSCMATTQSGEKTILPGQSIDISVIFNSRGKYGLTREQIAVNFDTSEIQPILLGIQAMVIGPVQWSPWQVDFGVVDQAIPLRPRVVLVRASDEDLAYAWTAESSNENIIAKVIPIDKEKYPEVGNMLGRMIEVSLSDNMPVGELAGEVFLKASDTGRELCVVPVRGRVRGGVYPMPRRLFLGEMVPGQKQSAVVEIRRAVGCVATVESVQVISPSLDARLLEIYSDGPIAARIEVSSKSAPESLGAFVEKIVVKTTDQSQELLSVEVTGMYISSRH